MQSVKRKRRRKLFRYARYKDFVRANSGEMQCHLPAQKAFGLTIFVRNRAPFSSSISRAETKYASKALEPESHSNVSSRYGLKSNERGTEGLWKHPGSEDAHRMNIKEKKASTHEVDLVNFIRSRSVRF